MKNNLLLSVIILIAVYATGCKSYSKYAIDEQPKIPMDSRLLGIWKAAEDTNPLDYIIVQHYDDVHALFSKNGTSNSDFLKKWEDENKPKSQYVYWMTRMDRGGRNRTYEHCGVFTSKIGKSLFLNVPYYNVPHGDRTPDSEENGYILVRILQMNATGDTLVTATVADETMKQLNSSKEVRARLEKNLRNAGFYRDTVHFYKVSGYHAAVKGSGEYANAKHAPIK